MLPPLAATLQSGAIAYGLKVDERIKVSSNAKLRTSLGRMYTKAGSAYDHGTALAADLRVKPGFDETMRVRRAAPRWRAGLCCGHAAALRHVAAQCCGHAPTTESTMESFVGRQRS